MFRRILVPLDGSPLAELALPHAVVAASAFDARIHLLRVLPVRRRGGAAPLDIIDRPLGQAEANAYVGAVAADLRGRGLTVETEVLEGHPPEQIIEVLRRTHADLLVLTTHGTGGCSEFPISGTAHKVISRAGISVLIVPTSEGQPASATYRRILVGLDGSQRGEWALGPAAALARHTGAELVLAHVVQVPETIEAPLSAELSDAAARLVRLNRQAAARHLTETCGHLECPELKIRTRIEVSTGVPETLAALAESEHADLVVLTAHGASGSTTRPYGAITVQVLSETRRPLLVTQDAPLRRDTTRANRASLRETAFSHQ